ncbi:MAG: hypothetical protein IPK16_10920 [Anaerolineales bacterium]|nr:hypothetical protein [Anaerolineales bacterium]
MIDVEISAHRISVFGDDAILVVAQDVTDRKLAEAQRDLMARVVNGSTVSTVIMDPKGVIFL